MSCQQHIARFPGCKDRDVFSTTGPMPQHLSLVPLQEERRAKTMLPVNVTDREFKGGLLLAVFVRRTEAT